MSFLTAHNVVVSFLQQFSVVWDYLEIGLLCMISSFLWILTGGFIHVLNIEPPRLTEEPPMAFPLGDETTIVKTEHPDGSVTVVTTTVIKPGDSSQRGLADV